jgi:ubiquinone/menaquinone biosynthesis C-methylase UbiE
MANDARPTFYDTTYAHAADELYAAIRRDAFGEDIGQNSWLTASEHRSFFEWLALDGGSNVLEIACGAGGPALFMAAETGCRVTGVDLHQAAIDAATAAAAARRLSARAAFLCADARRPLPFEPQSFDVVICIDSINHIYERATALTDWKRVLRPGGRILVTNPITVTGLLRREEMILRSGSMGEFVFTPPGEDARLLREIGFERIEQRDVTANMALVAGNRRASREQRRADLDRVEGAAENAAYNRFLEIVATLANERRLSRIAYSAQCPG